MANEYSVNLPTRFYYKKKWNNGWINVVNPFRASMVLGTPGSGKSYAIVNNYIKQQIEKGFAMYIYDYKFSRPFRDSLQSPASSLDAYKVKPQFYVINFDDPRKSHRCNPHQSCLYDGYIGRLRKCLHHHAQLEPLVDTEAGRFLCGVADYPIGSYYMVSENL